MSTLLLFLLHRRLYTAGDIYHFPLFLKIISLKKKINIMIGGGFAYHLLWVWLFFVVVVCGVCFIALFFGREEGEGVFCFKFCHCFPL